MCLTGSALQGQARSGYVSVVSSRYRAQAAALRVRTGVHLSPGNNAEPTG